MLPLLKERVPKSMKVLSRLQMVSFFLPLSVWSNVDKFHDQVTLTLCGTDPTIINDIGLVGRV